MSFDKRIRKGLSILAAAAPVILWLALPAHALANPTKDSIAQSIDALFQQQKYQDAHALCLGLKGKKQEKCFHCLGTAYLKANQYDNAWECYDKSGSMEDQFKLIDSRLQASAFDSALAFCQKLQAKLQFFPTEEKQRLYEQMGTAYYGLGDFPTAVEFFEKARPSAQRAAAYERLANEFVQKDDHTNAKKYYNKAVLDYEFLLKTFFHQWKPAYITSLRRCIEQRERLEKTPGEKAGQALLDRLLQGAGKYCERMNNSAFRFFCKEAVNELNDYTTDIDKIKAAWTNQMENKLIPPVRNKYLYEYQLIQENGKVHESRTLLKQNGVKINKAGAQLQTRVHHYEKLIFGPFALLSPFWQKRFYYKITGQEKLWKRDAVIIEAIPLHSYEKNHLFGSVWIDKTDFTVMRIQWHPKSIRFSRQIEQKARLLHARPEINFFAEFKTQKRGIRFPSRFFIEEAYINKKGNKYVRSRQDIKMKDYLFFVVASEVLDTKPGVWK
jgi:tetratricopeptide (TPR) repeat protein